MPDPKQIDLSLVQGSEKPFDIFLFDENDNPDDLTLVTDATFVVQRDINDPIGSALINIDTTVGGLSINKPLSKLTGVLSLAEAQALPVGTFIGQAGVKSSGQWFFTDPFNVIVRSTFGVTV